MDHYSNAVFSEPGRCWRFISSPDGTGRPDFCPSRSCAKDSPSSRVAGESRLSSCEGHSEGSDWGISDRAIIIGLLHRNHGQGAPGDGVGFGTAPTTTPVGGSFNQVPSGWS